MEFKDWISSVANNEWIIYIKRLSSNDTGATDSNQVGVYVPKETMWRIFPSMKRTDQGIHDCLFTGAVDSDGVPEKELRMVWYNQKTRDEARITRWKQGVKYTPLQDADKTGALALFAFNFISGKDPEYMKSWVCKNLDEENYLEERMGEVDPQSTFCERGDIVFEGVLSSGKIKLEKYPETWNDEFPSGADIINYLFEKGFHSNLAVDSRILKRRDHEFDLFKLVEHHHSFPLIEKGFDGVEAFIKLANSISNRRKSRSGKSLELHLENIFKEEGLSQFGVQCTTEGKKKPDFLFPNCSSYHDPEYPDAKLRMLAVKTTVKDRWRQILNEANRIETSYLFTLQQGVSNNQFREMQEENVKLVVPRPLHTSFPKEIRDDLYSLSGFIEETKTLYL